ncbi:MAG: ribosomal protein S18-alanine N-acetyltransferase [Calditrichaceae bacterium]|nr:ribosomal protein S18-alanine N-acetyltransferase [Calditrichia bacterium]NUQ41998.1 ribosomal protein S18-alanine N-acetyltransferase [Calditrichaceae bacterium]
MSDRLTTRYMTVEDLDAVMEIERRVFIDPWSRKSYEFEIIENRYSLPLVLEYAGKIVGYAVVWQVYEEFHIASLAIAPEQQGRGWGKYLLETLLKLADNADYALLEVRPSNTRAIRMYEQFGFTRLGVRKRYYQNGEDALVMRKMLRKL